MGKWLAVSICLLVLTACSSLQTHMSAASDLNPDVAGNPSPLAVSVFELSSPEAFLAADFIHLYTDPAATLGSSLLVERDLMIVPGQNITISMPVAKGVTSLAYLAAYRNLDQVRWREVVTVMPGFWSGAAISLHFDQNGMEVLHSEKSILNGLWS